VQVLAGRLRQAASVSTVSPPFVVNRPVTALESLTKPLRLSDEMSMTPRKVWSVSRMLFTTWLPVLPSWMLMAQRPSAACTMVLWATKLLREGWPPSIW
jgi:hypothetical protein